MWSLAWDTDQPQTYSKTKPMHHQVNKQKKPVSLGNQGGDYNLGISEINNDFYNLQKTRKRGREKRKKEIAHG